MNTDPPTTKEEPLERISTFRRRKVPAKDDVELAEVKVADVEDYSGRNENGVVQSEISHYTLAEQMINYQSIDFGTRCM